MTSQMFTLMLVIFVLGLFVGSNLGVILMCLLQGFAKQAPAEAELVHVPVHIDD